MPTEASEPAIQIVNPPAAGMVDDLVAAAMLLRFAVSERKGHQDDIGSLCAKAAARLESHAASLRDPAFPLAL